MKIGQARVGPIPIRDVSVAYSRTPEGDRWEGGATLELPGPKLASLTGFAAFLNGRFAEGRGALTGNVVVYETDHGLGSPVPPTVRLLDETGAVLR